jgi:hypothetical protein
MEESAMNVLPEDEDLERARVAETLERLRSGVRQRQAEVSTGAGAREEVRVRLLELKSHEFLTQPPCFSHRRVLGPLIVFARKAAFQLFMKWYLHPIVQQQNRFNQIASRLLEELAEENAKLRRRITRLEEPTWGGEEGERR